MKYEIAFDLSPLKELDDLCLLADQDYNYGDKNSWFLSFRGGFDGAKSRLDTVRIHYNAMHAWQYPPQNTEYNLSIVLFGMDSAIECFTFAMNAIGNCLDDDEKKFKNLADAKALRGINPSNVIGDAPLPGYKEYFSGVQQTWFEARETLRIIIDNHDVSKHRKPVDLGGNLRQDAPSGFFENLGITQEHTKLVCLPMAQIFLERYPKNPEVNKYPIPQNELVIFEELAEDYRLLINKTAQQLLSDAKKAFKLKHTKLR